MPRNVHIHIHRHKRTVDAGWDESKHKRGEGGKFATTGASGGAAEHHEARAEEHSKKFADPKTPEEHLPIHANAMWHHQLAAEELRKRDRLGPTGQKDVHDLFQRTAQHHADYAAQHEAKLQPKKEPHPDDDLVSVKMAGHGEEKTHAIPKPPPGTSGGPQKGRGPVDLSTQRSGETHHTKLQEGMHLFDKSGRKIDEIESIGRAMHAAERTIHTRAGYQHVTKGGHLPDGVHAKPGN